MQDFNDIIALRVAERTGLPAKGVGAVIELLDEGATVPFISRYRKERTGSLDEVAVRLIETTLRQVRELEARREFVGSAISETGAMTEQISRRLAEAQTMTDIEDIYAPFKPKRRTRATAARERGLEPAAKKIMSGFMPPLNDDDLAGARDIIAEWASESPRLRNIARREVRQFSTLASTPAKGKEAELEASPWPNTQTSRRACAACPHINTSPCAAPSARAS